MVRIKIFDKTHRLIIETLKILDDFPYSENYGLRSRIKISASSMLDNIKGVYKKRGRPDYCDRFNSANNSLEETKYNLLLACNLGYIEQVAFKKLLMSLNEIKQLLVDV
ncbi:MAG: four helix bundle protein [Candidatus Omnitrophica bacterium]|nr:four helix bundle protein [Candidatus Omnitrophota bacterium]